MYIYTYIYIYIAYLPPFLLRCAVYTCSGVACVVNLLIKYVLLKALSPVCMKYTAQDESLVANMVQSQVLYLSQDSHQELYTFIQTKWQCFKCFIVFYTY